MSIRSKRDIYVAIEKALKNAEQPLTAARLYEINEVREAAKRDFSTTDGTALINSISNCLGLMWRNELVTRYPAPAEVNSRSMARYGYLLSDKRSSKGVPPTPINPTKKGGKQGFIIEEIDDGILLDFEKFTVFIKSK